MKRDLVVFGEDWGAHPSSTQHLVRHLCSDRKVIWINSIGMRRPRLSRSDVSRALRKVRQMAHPITNHPNAFLPRNLSVLEPRALPLPGNKIAGFVNRRTIGQAIKAEMGRRNIVNPVVWASLPTAVDVIGAFPDNEVVYYCGDDFGALNGVDHGPVLGCEKRLAERADLILASSEYLCAKFDAPKTRYLPHGVDLNRFATPFPRAKDLPKGKKVAGFYGSISAWLDIDLLRRTACLLPDWKFVFIGNVSVDVSTLNALPNVVFLGPKEHAELPGYVQHWTASLLPFVDNAQIRACNPLKLREYLAAGRPVIATSFPALDPYLAHISVASTPETFALELKKAETEPSSTAKCRSESVSCEDWKARANDLGGWLDAV